MKVIIDRFEGEFAVVELENRETVDLSKKLVPNNAVEGDVLEITVDKKTTSDRRERINKLCEGLWE